jgi:prolyl-tRNA synthetase
MGCYGIGVNRIVARPSRPGHDENGIIWPLNLAPYHVLLVPLQIQNPAVIETSATLEKALADAGYDVLVDDRDQRPGFKFKDADLIGIPLRW